jgi:hypothetical protein
VVAGLVITVLIQLPVPNAQGRTAVDRATTTAVQLHCPDQISSLNSPRPGTTTAFGAVALPTRRALGAVVLPNAADPNARYFAKQGLQVRAGASFELVVPPEWRGRLSFGWGLPAQRTTDVKVSGCRWMANANQRPPAGRWLGFAGGFWVRSPACVAVLVKAHHETRRVHIGIGAACPGESPPRVLPTQKALAKPSA